MDTQPRIGIGILIISIGFIVLVAGILLSGIPGKSEVKGGAVIFIGPVPLAFGTDRNSLLIVSVLMIVLMLVAYMLFRR